MFASGPNYAKLKTNLRLAVNRLKLLEKKKTELALKARKEIADYLSDGKVERARIRVEHIIREDYLVEAYEIVEMLADLLLARFGLIQQMKELDEGLKEAISSLIWVAPRLQADVNELKPIGDALIAKYGKPYGLACYDNTVQTVSPKLLQKLSVKAPPKILVEKYLIEIARIFNVDYEPDAKIMHEGEDTVLIDMGEENNLDRNGPSNGASGGGGSGHGGGGGGVPAGMQPPGFIGYPYMPVPSGPDPAQAHPMSPPAYQAFQYPTVPKEDKLSYNSHSPPPKFPGFNIPPAPDNDFKELNVDRKEDPNLKPKPAPRVKPQPPAGPPANDSFDFSDLPDLPAVPSAMPSDRDLENHGKPSSNEDNEIDFDDLTKRFEELKKRK